MDTWHRDLWPAIQPLICETGHSDFPYAVPGGTIFLATYQGRLFAITARHVLHPLNPICLFSSDFTDKLLPLEDVFFVPFEKCEEEYQDIAIAEFDPRKLIRDTDFKCTKFIDLEKTVNKDWLACAGRSRFAIFGYPSDHSQLDYENKNTTTRRFSLFASYHGMFFNHPGVHSLKIHNAATVSSFNGFSGSPVFGWLPEDTRPNTITFCGMVLRGTQSPI